MSLYRYVARDKDGTVFKGKIDADDEANARSSLRQKGLFATSTAVVREWHPRKLLGRVSADEVAILAEQLSILIDAGLPLMRCFTILAKQSKNGKLKEVLNGVYKNIENGASFADSLSKHPEVFSKLFVNLIRAGEIGGTLGKSLSQLTTYLEKEQQTRQQIKSALTYPKVVSSICLVVTIFVVTFIVPRFSTLYDSMGIKLPLATIVLVKTSKLMLGYWWVILGSVLGIVIAYMKFKASRIGKWVIDRASLYLPVFGDLNKKAVASRFIRVLSSLALSGIPIMRALEVSQQVADNMVISRIIEEARMKVSFGGKLEETLSSSDIFPSMVINMIALGEETGDLSGALEKGANYLEREVDVVVKRLIIIIEPVMTVLIAFIVGLLALAIYLPMFDVVKGVSSH